MKKNIFLLFVLIFINTLLFSQSLPELTGRVVDITGTLTNEQRIDLETILKNYEEKRQHQMVVAIIRSLNGYSIEEYSIRLAEKWKIGRKDFDDGVIILVSMGDRKIRIEVGYGLESQLTDAECFLIIERIIKPAFKNGDYYDGLKSAILQIEKETGMEDSSTNINNNDYSTYTKKEYSNYSKTKRSSKNTPFWALFFGFIFAIIIKTFFKFMKNLGKIASFFGFILGFIISIIVFFIVASILDFFVLFFIFSFIFGLFILSSKRSSGVDIGSTTYTNYGGGIFGNWGDSSSNSWNDSSSSFDNFSGGGGDFGGGGASGDW